MSISQKEFCQRGGYFNTTNVGWKNFSKCFTKNKHMKNNKVLECTHLAFEVLIHFDDDEHG